MSREADSLADFVGGDLEGARSLRYALGGLRDLDVDPDLRARIDAVLKGDLTMRELADDPRMNEIAGEGLSRLRQELSDMSPEQRAQLVRQSVALAKESDPDQRDSDRDSAEL